MLCGSDHRLLPNVAKPNAVSQWYSFSFTCEEDNAEFCGLFLCTRSLANKPPPSVF